MEFDDLKIDDSGKLPMFDLPVDFVVYDNVTAMLLNFYGNFPCKMDTFVLAMCESGSVKATINLWNYEVKPNDFAIIIPGSFIQIDQVSDDVKVCFVAFSSKFLRTVNFWKSMSKLLMPAFINPVVHIEPKLARVYLDTFSLLTRASELEDTALFSSEMIRDILHLFIDSLSSALSANMAHQSSAPSSRESEIVGEFLQLAFENYRDEHKISFYAHEVNLTLSHFCNVISKTTGMTPQEIIMNLIIMDAKTQLKGTEHSVAKISSILGFVTPTTFNRYFKTYTGLTPQEYRNS